MYIVWKCTEKKSYKIFKRWFYVKTYSPKFLEPDKVVGDCECWLDFMAYQTLMVI